MARLVPKSSTQGSSVTCKREDDAALNFSVKYEKNIANTTENFKDGRCSRRTASASPQRNAAILFIYQYFPPHSPLSGQRLGEVASFLH
jgi:hypothetical protein